jgi:hypothetical protein
MWRAECHRQTLGTQKLCISRSTLIQTIIIYIQGTHSWSCAAYIWNTLCECVCVCVFVRYHIWLNIISCIMFIVHFDHYILVCHSLDCTRNTYLGVLTNGYQINFCRSRQTENLWSSGQSSWLQIQRSGFDCRCYQIFWEVVGLERGPLSLVSTIEELLGRKSSGSGLESREYGRRDLSHWQHGTLYPQTLELTSPTSSGRSVGIVRSWTQATEFSLVFLLEFFSKYCVFFNRNRKLF